MTTPLQGSGSPLQGPGSLHSAESQDDSDDFVVLGPEAKGDFPTWEQVASSLPPEQLLFQCAEYKKTSEQMRVALEESVQTVNSLSEQLLKAKASDKENSEKFRKRWEQLTEEQNVLKEHLSRITEELAATQAENKKREMEFNKLREEFTSKLQSLEGSSSSGPYTQAIPETNESSTEAPGIFGSETTRSDFSSMHLPSTSTLSNSVESVGESIVRLRGHSMLNDPLLPALDSEATAPDCSSMLRNSASTASSNSTAAVGVAGNVTWNYLQGPPLTQTNVLSETLHKAQDDNRKLQESLEERESEIGKLKGELQLVSTELGRLRDENGQLKKSNAQAEKKIKEHEYRLEGMKEGQAAFAKVENESLQKVQNENLMLQSFIKKDAEQIGKLEADNQRVQAELAEKTAQIEKLQADYERVQAELAERDSVFYKLEADYQKLQSEFAESSRSSTVPDDGYLRKLNTELEDVRLENRRLNELNQKLCEEKQMKDHQEQLELQRQFKALNESEQKYKEAVRNVEILKNQLHNLAMEKKEVEQWNRKHTSDLAEKQVTVMNQLASTQRVSQELQDIQQRYGDLHNAIENERSQKANLELQIEQLKKQADRNFEALQDSEQRVREYSRIIDQLEQREKELADRVLLFENQADAFKADFETERKDKEKWFAESRKLAEMMKEENKRYKQHIAAMTGPQQQAQTQLRQPQSATAPTSFYECPMCQDHYSTPQLLEKHIYEKHPELA